MFFLYFKITKHLSSKEKYFPEKYLTSAQNTKFGKAIIGIIYSKYCSKLNL